MRVLGALLVGVLVLSFVKAAAQLAVLAAVGLALIFALKSPTEALGCTAMLVLIGIGQQYPLAAMALLAGLAAIGLREKF